MKLKLQLSLLLVLLLSVGVFAQKSYTLTGKVFSAADRIPIPGVNVVVVDSKGGASTDFDGNYSLVVKTGDKIQFSYIGFKNQVITITNQKTLDVSLSTSENQLEQVVVIGYGTQKKRNLTGAISKVTNKELDQIPVSRVDDALNGQVSGVTISQSNPTAGGAPTIKVRGQGSLSFTGSPLIVIDGVVVGNDADFLGSLDMNNVESVDILKDASSSSIYGSRGSYGVILITSKKGKEGPATFNYNTYVGYKFVPRTDILSTPAKWSAFVLSQNNGELTDQMKMINQMGTYTNWEKEMYDGGVITDHSLSISGGSEFTKYRTSIGYNSDEGVQLTDNYKKINLSLNLDTKSGKLEYGVMMNPSYTKQRLFAAGTGNINYIRQQPWLPIYIDENTYNYVNHNSYPDVAIGDYAEERFFTNYNLTTNSPGTGTTSINVTGDGNPYANVVERSNIVYQTKLYGNTYFKINFNDDFNFKQSIGGDYRINKTINRTGVNATKNYSTDASTVYTTATEAHVSAESLFSYSKSIKKHDISAVAGYTFENFDYENTSITGTGYTSDLIETISTTNVYAGGAYTSESQEKLISFLARVNYAYDDKYLFSVSMRRDGSSKFGLNNKFGNFPAASVGWRLSNEKFLENSSIIKDLKLRASYGTTGNNAGIGDYASLGLVNSVGTGFTTGTTTGYTVSNIENADLKWEKLVEFNPGIDASFFGGVFGLSLDYYIRTSKDFLLDLPIPAGTGFSTALVNGGKLENKGFELELRSTNIKTDNFSWTTSALISHNKNTLLDFEGNSGLISNVDSKRAAEWIALEGKPIASFYGYVATDEIPLKNIINPLRVINSQSQDIYVKDLNDDGVIDDNDKTILGNPYPDVVWSLTNNIRYKNIDLSFMFQGSHGAEVRNLDSQYINNEFNSYSDTYTSTTNTSTYPVWSNAEVLDAASVAKTKERIFTSYDVQDASYFALRNVNIGYTFSKDLVGKFGLSKLRLYCGAQNLIYIMAKGYTGYNPEGNLESNTSPLTAGYQVGAAPIYKTVSFGLNLQF